MSVINPLHTKGAESSFVVKRGGPFAAFKPHREHASGQLTGSRFKDTSGGHRCRTPHRLLPPEKSAYWCGRRESPAILKGWSAELVGRHEPPCSSSVSLARLTCAHDCARRHRDGMNHVHGGGAQKQTRILSQVDAGHANASAIDDATNTGSRCVAQARKSKRSDSRSA